MGDLDRIRALGNHTLQFVSLHYIRQLPNTTIYWGVRDTAQSRQYITYGPYGTAISILAGHLDPTFTRRLGTFVNYRNDGRDGNTINFSDERVNDLNIYIFIDPFQQNWDNRKDYISFTEGTPGASGHVSQYLHNDYIQRAVSTYMGGKKSKTRKMKRRRMRKMRKTYRRARK